MQTMSHTRAPSQPGLMRSQQGANDIPVRPHASTIYFFAVLGTYALATLLARHPPLLQDYPTWVYEGVAFSHFLTGHADPQFAVKLFPVPNVLSDFGLGLLCTVVPWQIAAKLWIILYLALSSFCYMFFFRTVGLAASPARWIAPSLCIVNLCFWWGFLNFQYGLAFMVLFCALLLRSPVRRTALTILFIVVFSCHAIPFLVCGMALFCYVTARRAYFLLLTCIPVALIGIWYLYGRYVLTGNRESSVLPAAHINYASPLFAIYKLNCYFKSIGYVHPRLDNALKAGGIAEAGHIGLLLVTAIVGLALLAMFFRSVRESATISGRTGFVWLTVAFCFLVALLCPSEALGISDPGTRFFTCGLTLAMLCSIWTRASLVACVGSVTLGVLGCYLFVKLSLHDYSYLLLPEAPSIRERFASVAPRSRAYYYDSLAAGRMDLPTFDTGSLLNRDAHQSTGPTQSSSSP